MLNLRDFNWVKSAEFLYHTAYPEVTLKREANQAGDRGLCCLRE